MDLKTIKELIALLEKSGIQRLTIKEKNGEEISLDKGSPHSMTSPMPAQSKPHQMMPPSAAMHHSGIPTPHESPASDEIDPKKCIHSPMVGTFYASSSPDAAPYIIVGNHVKKGDTICIIEAMKVMNEVKSDRDGKVVKAFLESGSPVEYGQPLFLIE